MSVETISPDADPRPAAARLRASRRAARAGGAVRLVVGVLADGTAFYAPLGEVVVVNDALVICHLCGRALRSVTAHLRAHGWTKEAYCQAFGLERGQSLEGLPTRKLRAAALAARLVFDPAIREGSAAGRDRARTGELARDAAAAARGRALPEQRRRKALRALAAIPPARVARANAERPAAPGRGRGRRRPQGRVTQTSGPSSWRGSRREPAWPPSAGRPGCTRTGCRVTSVTSTPRRPRPCAATARHRPGGMPRGSRHSAVSASPT